MTGLGVERLPRAASPSVSADASAPLPPHIQGAERQRSRWAMRLLVVGGLAGAAWLLTGAAAHAADRADGPAGSLLGSVVGGDTTLPVTGLLTAAAQPLEAVPAHKHHVVADILEVPQRVLSRPVETVDEITHGGTGTTVDAAAGSVDTVLREVAGPLRLTGGPTTTKQQIIAVVADPVATPPVAIPDGRPIAEQPAVAPVEATAPAAPMISSHLSRPSRAPIAGAVRAGVVARHLKAASHRIAHRHRVVRPTTADDATASGDSPGGDGPAPLQLHLGDVSGTSTSGSGTPTEGGSAAFLPAAIASSTMACHRLPIVSDVEVRRIHAEAPTVSPD